MMLSYCMMLLMTICENHNPDFTSRSCQTKRYAMLGWQLSYFTNVCTVQLEVSFMPHGDQTSKLQQELMLQYNSSLRY